MSAHHIVSSFDEDLKFLEEKITAMWVSCSSMLERAVTSVLDGNKALADEIINEDLTVDQTDRYITEKVVAIIAKRQPMAIDLRELVGTIRISNDLERVGDMALSIAKRTKTISTVSYPSSLHCGLGAYFSLVLEQLKEGAETYKNRSLEKILALYMRDDEIDGNYTTVFRDLLTYMMEDPRNITPCTDLLFCAKNLERVGDHVTNIAETLHYIVTGDYMPIERLTDSLKNQKEI